MGTRAAGPQAVVDERAEANMNGKICTLDTPRYLKFDITRGSPQSRRRPGYSNSTEVFGGDSSDLIVAIVQHFAHPRGVLLGSSFPVGFVRRLDVLMTEDVLCEHRVLLI